MYNSYSRGYLASAELQDKFELDECNSSFQLTVKNSDLTEKFRASMGEKVRQG